MPKRPPVEKLPPGIAATHQDVAIAFGVAKRTVENWSANGMPKNDDGTYHLIKIAEWRYNKQPSGKSSIEKLTLKDQVDIALKRARKRTEDARWRKMKGELVSRQEVDQSNVVRVNMVKRAMLSTPRAVAPIITELKDVTETQKYLEAVMHELCNIFAGKRGITDAATGASAGTAKPRRTGRTQLKRKNSVASTRKPNR